MYLYVQLSYLIGEGSAATFLGALACRCRITVSPPMIQGHSYDQGTFLHNTILLINM